MTSENSFYSLVELERDTYRQAIADLKYSGVLVVSPAEQQDVRQAYPCQSKKKALDALEKFNWERFDLPPTETAERRKQLLDIQHWGHIQRNHSQLGPRARWSLSFALLVGVVMVTVLTRFESLYTNLGWWINVLPAMCAGYAVVDYYNKAPRSWTPTGDGRNPKQVPAPWQRPSDHRKSQYAYGPKVPVRRRGSCELAQ